MEFDTIGNVSTFVPQKKIPSACGVAVDMDGFLFVTDDRLGQVFRVSPSGDARVLAGGAGPRSGRPTRRQSIMPGKEMDTVIAASAGGTSTSPRDPKDALAPLLVGSPSPPPLSNDDQSLSDGPTTTMGIEAIFARPTAIAVATVYPAPIAPTIVQPVPSLPPRGLSLTLTPSGPGPGVAQALQLHSQSPLPAPVIPVVIPPSPSPLGPNAHVASSGAWPTPASPQPSSSSSSALASPSPIVPSSNTNHLAPPPSPVLPPSPSPTTASNVNSTPPDSRTSSRHTTPRSSFSSPILPGSSSSTTTSSSTMSPMMAALASATPQAQPYTLCFVLDRPARRIYSITPYGDVDLLCVVPILGDIGGLYVDSGLTLWLSVYGHAPTRRSTHMAAGGALPPGGVPHRRSPGTLPLPISPGTPSVASSADEGAEPRHFLLSCRPDGKFVYTLTL
jgi:hypothetical protein